MFTKNTYKHNLNPPDRTISTKPESKVYFTV